MKNIILALLVSLSLQPAFAANQKTTKTSLNSIQSSTLRTPAMAAYSWAQIRSGIINMTLAFLSPKYSSEQKMDLLPQTNELLAYMQDIKFKTPEEKVSQIALVVNLLVASSPYDYASSNIDTLVEDYIAFKGIYDEEINKIQHTKTRVRIFKTFQLMTMSM